MPRTKDQKKVVYLIGTGASHAEIMQRKASNLGLLMGQVTQGIFSKLSEDNVRDPSIKELLNALDTGKPNPYNIDIESVITLYESSGTRLDKKRANTLKRYFRTIVSERTKQGEAAGEPPTLLSVLLDMYSVDDFDEKLMAVITLNYDDFIEQAFLDVLNGINYPFEIDKSYRSHLSSSLPPLCKLHGSFNWENTNPVKFHLHFASEDEERVLWVPPGVTKRFDYYPFNAIWASARASLECDILRIIGCSLSRNDWNLIALLHTTNRLRNNILEKYEIQYIDYPQSFKRAWHDFSYFGKFKSITQVREFALYMTAEHKEQYEAMGGESEEEKMDAWLDAQQRTTNIFAEWLRAMAHHWRIEKGKSISTDKNYFESFFLNGRLK